MGFVTLWPRLRQGATSVWLPFALMLALAPVYIRGALVPAVSVAYHDDSVYMVTARALARGEGYRISSLPDAIYQTKYPPVYPALLALLWTVFPKFPANIIAFKLASVVFAAMWIWTTHRLCRRMTLSPAAAAWICFAVLGARWSVLLSTLALPDTLFWFLCTWGALRILDLSESDRDNPAHIAAAATIVAAAVLTRSVGIALIPAAMAAFLLRRRFRLAIAFGACAAAFIAPWILWQHAHAAPLDRVLAYYSKACYAGGTIMSIGWERALNVIVTNTIMMGVGFQVLTGASVSMAGLLASLTLSVIVIRGIAADLRASSCFVPLWFAAYSLTLIAWVWLPVRYEAPLLPLGLIWVVKSVRGLQSERLKAVATSVLIGVAIYSAALTFATELRLYRPPASANVDAAEEFRKLSNLAGWVSEHAGHGAVMSANIDPAVYLLTGRKSIRLFTYDPYSLVYEEGQRREPVGSLASFTAHILNNRIDYLLLTDMNVFIEGEFLRRLLNRAVVACPNAFQVAMRDRDPRYFVMRVNRDELARCSVPTEQLIASRSR
jgi:hypothetical protein